MTSTDARSAHRLDPDALAALEERRDFLLASLSDLESEHAAGDIDELDYLALKDDYTRRAAVVLRSIDRQEAAFAAAPKLDWRRALVWVLGLALLGGISGVLIARASGDRIGGESGSGGVRQSIVTRLSTAQSLFGDPDTWDDAIEIYDDILDEEPTQVEALTYRSWLQYRQGEPLAGVLPGWEEAALLEPAYPDAIVFHTIALSDLGFYDDAADVLDRLDYGAAPPVMQGILDDRGLRGQVYAETNRAAIEEAAVVDLDTLGVDARVALEMAAHLLTTESPQRSVSAIKLFDAVLAHEPTNPAALSRKALLLAQTGDQDLLRRAAELLTTAVEANPDDLEARLSRATVVGLSDTPTACADLEAIEAIRDDLGGLPQVFLDQLTRLRAQIPCG